jgi:hypothetical protein
MAIETGTKTGSDEGFDRITRCALSALQHGRIWVGPPHNTST